MATDAYKDEEAGFSEEEEPASDFDTFGAEALGISLDDPDAPTRLAALKEAVMACMGTDYSKDEKKKSKGKTDEGFALIFGED